MKNGFLLNWIGVQLKTIFKKKIKKFDNYEINSHRCVSNWRTLIKQFGDYQQFCWYISLSSFNFNTQKYTKFQVNWIIQEHAKHTKANKLLQNQIMEQKYDNWIKIFAVSTSTNKSQIVKRNHPKNFSFEIPHTDPKFIWPNHSMVLIFAWFLRRLNSFIE